MPVAVVDSNVVIGFANRRDQNHDRARAIMHGIDSGTLPTARLTNYVVAEALNYIHERQRHDVAVDLHNRLESGTGFEFVHAPVADFTRAAALFERYEQLSFVDATVVAYMQRESIDYLYSFDDGFDVVDAVTRLTTPDDPYSPS